MAHFRYKVRTHAGELLNGTLEAATLSDAGAALRADGHFIVKLDEARARLAAGANAAAVRPGANGKIKRADVITFAHQLAVMVDTGVPISEALECVAEQSENVAFQVVLEDVAETVQAGGELSKALAAHPKVFPPVMISLVKASEVSGTMGMMLERISTYMAKEQATLRKIRGALTYPAVMLGMVMVVTAFLIMFVLPRFAGIYANKGAALPAPTRLLMAISDFTTAYWPYLIGGCVVTPIALLIALRTEQGRWALDTLKLKAPLIGKLFSKLYITRSCRTMGTMINAGVPILDMVEITRHVTRNVHFEAMWDEVGDKLQRGAQLSDGMFASPLIPRSVAQMVFSGEKAGRLGPVMEKIADYTEEEFDEQVKQTTQYIEPLMVITMGSLIGFIAISLLLPIFNVSAVVSG